MSQTTVTTPQVILFLSDHGELLAEVPSKNGVRKKLFLPRGKELLTLKTELLAQRDIVKTLQKIKIQQGNEKRQKYLETNRDAITKFNRAKAPVMELLNLL